MNRFKFRVECPKIRGKARPRFNVYTKKVYTTPEDKAFEGLIRNSYLEQDGIYFGEDSYLKLKVDLYFSVPKSYTKKRRSNCIKNIERPAKKPDIDNILKSICDSIQNGIAFNDDTQVISVEANKYYTDKVTDFMDIELIEL